MKTRISIKRVVLICLGLFLFDQINAQHTTTFKFTETAPESVLRVMEKNANVLFSEINRKYDLDSSILDIPSSVIDEFARKRIKNMWAVSHFYCTKTSVTTDVLKMVSSDSYQVRNIPVCYKRGESDEYRYQHIVLEFDKSGKITDLYRSLPEHDSKIVEGNIVTDFRHKELINNFINSFFTAYNCKDTVLIEQMYSDDALIITGKVVSSYKTGNNNEMSKRLTKDARIVYNVQNKKEYLAKLKGIFARNEYINIRFDGVEIMQSEANPSYYGVRLNQYWHVSRKANVKGYYDEGKLFLVIDFTDEDRPVIWLRTWQPFKDAEGKTIRYSEEDFFGLDDYPIEKR